MDTGSHNQIGTQKYATLSGVVEDTWPRLVADDRHTVLFCELIDHRLF